MRWFSRRRSEAQAATAPPAEAPSQPHPIEGRFAPEVQRIADLLIAADFTALRRTSALPEAELREAVLESGETLLHGPLDGFQIPGPPYAADEPYVEIFTRFQTPHGPSELQMTTRVIPPWDAPTYLVWGLDTP